MTGLPSRTTSVMTATTEVVISEKSKLEFLMSDLSGIAHSRMSTIRIWALFLLIPVTVRSARSKVLFRTPSFAQAPRDGWDAGISAGCAPRQRSNPLHRGDEYGRQRSFRCSPGNAGVCRKERRPGAAGLRRLYFRGAPSHERLRRAGRDRPQGRQGRNRKGDDFRRAKHHERVRISQELVRARDVQDVLRLQADYIKRQMQVLTEQARELGESTSKAAKDAATPKR